MIINQRHQISPGDLIIVTSYDYSTRSRIASYIRSWVNSQPNLLSVRVEEMENSDFNNKSTTITIFSTQSIDQIFENTVLR